MRLYVILDFGCGRAKAERADESVIGIDINRNSDADVIYDLNRVPLPFKDNSFDEIICNDILEHLEDVFGVMAELHRIGKNQAVVRIRVPHFSSMDAYADPTHKRSFTSRSFNYITGNYPELEFYTTLRFRKKKFKIEFWQINELGNIRPQEWFGIGLFANKLTSIYERFFAFIFPAQSIYFELEIVK